MENPNATWNDFSTRIIQRDVSFQVSSNFLNDEEQTKAQMATLGQEMKNLRSELQEHRVNAVEGNSRTVDPNQKGRQNATRFCNYCRTNGHTPSWCRKKIRDEELKRIENERTAEKKVTFTQDYNKKNEDETMAENNGPEAKIFKDETRTLAMIDSGEVHLITTKISLQDPTLHIETTVRTIDDHLINAQISHLIETMETDPDMNLSTTRMGTGGTMETFLVLHQIQEETSQNNSYRPPRNEQSNNLAFRRSDNRPTANFTPYEQKYPQNNQTSSNVVRFTTTDDTINELSDLCPLNY